MFRERYLRWRIPRYSQTLLKFRGNVDLIDEGINSINADIDRNLRNPRTSFAKLKNMDRNLGVVTTLLKDYFDQEHSAIQSQHLCFYQKLVDEISSSFLPQGIPLVVLGKVDKCSYTPKAGPLSYIITASYLRNQSLSNSYMISHEVGHALYHEYMNADVRRRDAMEEVVLGMTNAGLRSGIVFRPDQNQVKIILSWLREFISDTLATILFGPAIPRMWFEENRKSRGWSTGSNTHPPPTLRFHEMRKLSLRYSHAQSFSSESLQMLQRTSESYRNRLGRNVPRPRELLFNPLTIESMIRVSLKIVEWGGINCDYSLIEQARQEIEAGQNPNSIVNGFAAYLDLQNSDVDPLSWA